MPPTSVSSASDKDDSRASPGWGTEIGPRPCPPLLARPPRHELTTASAFLSSLTDQRAPKQDQRQPESVSAASSLPARPPLPSSPRAPRPPRLPPPCGSLPPEAAALSAPGGCPRPSPQPSAPTRPGLWRPAVLPCAPLRPLPASPAAPRPAGRPKSPGAGSRGSSLRRGQAWLATDLLRAA